MSVIDKSAMIYYTFIILFAHYSMFSRCAPLTNACTNHNFTVCVCCWTRAHKKNLPQRHYTTAPVATSSSASTICPLKQSSSPVVPVTLAPTQRWSCWSPAIMWSSSTICAMHSPRRALQCRRVCVASRSSPARISFSIRWTFETVPHWRRCSIRWVRVCCLWFVLLFRGSPLGVEKNLGQLSKVWQQLLCATHYEECCTVFFLMYC